MFSLILVGSTATKKRKGFLMSGEHDDLEARHAAAWTRYIAADQQELENWRNGHLRKLLNGPLPGESPEELERLASEDEARAEEGLVELRSPRGEVYYKHIDALTPDDRLDRTAAEGRRVEWHTQLRRIIRS
jgi:hypothetical protein